MYSKIFDEQFPAHALPLNASMNFLKNCNFARKHLHVACEALLFFGRGWFYPGFTPLCGFDRHRKRQTMEPE
jgi:hypothetical protein